jgi:hypothetical protein
MAARFVSVDRNTPMLLPPDLRDWVEEDDLVHFVIEAVDRLPLGSFRVNHRGTGAKQFPPHMMLAIKMGRAIEELESRARQRQQKAGAKYEEKKAERREKEKKTGKKCTGREPKPPEKKAEDSKEQCNLSDPDARIMRKNKRASFTQSYNAQAAVDADGSQLVVGQHVSQSASDYAELENGVASIPGQLGKPEAVLADAGYVNADAFDRLEQASVEIYCSVHREDAHNERHYDFRPQKTSGRAVKEPSDGRLVAMRDKLRTEEGKALYGRRNHTVEPVFGIIKAAMGFRGFSLRGKEKVSGEWTLVCLAYNLRRLHGMMGGAKDGAGRPESGSMGSNPSPILPVDKWLGRIIHTIFRQLHRLTTESTAKLVLTPTGS